MTIWCLREKLKTAESITDNLLTVQNRDNQRIKMTKRTTTNNKNYMSIAVSLLIAEFTARNNGGAARKESNPQSATIHSAKR